MKDNIIKGKVKWFNEAKGFGFIEQENGPDIFVHYSEIASCGFKSLSEGQSVQFTLEQGEKGLEAKHIITCGPHGGGGGKDD